MNAKNQTPGEPLVAIVDDDVSMRGSARRLVRCSGLQSEVFVSAEDFLQSGRVVETACQVMDVRVPGMGGLALLRHLVETRPTDPDLASSALELARCSKRRTMRAGATIFLRKPVSREALLHAIRAVLKSPDNHQWKEL